MDAVEDSVLEDLKCPICFHLPKGKVFQCKDGHVLCEDCQRPLNVCPQCRIPFPTDGIRNRVLESMLDNLKLDCPYQESGCQEKLKRQTMEDHIEKCSYNTSRTSIKFCELIGIPNCHFLVLNEKVGAAVNHFKTAHQFIIEKSEFFRLEYLQFADFLKGEVNPNSGTDISESKQILLGKPIVMTNAKKTFAVLPLPIMNKVDKSVSWIPVGIGCGKETQVQFYLNNNSEKKVPSVNWGSTTTNIMETPKVLANSDYIPIPASLLERNCTEGCLFLGLKIKVEKDHPVVFDEALNICVMPYASSLNLQKYEQPKASTVKGKLLGVHGTVEKASTSARNESASSNQLAQKASLPEPPLQVVNTNQMGPLHTGFAMLLNPPNLQNPQLHFPNFPSANTRWSQQVESRRRGGLPSDRRGRASSHYVPPPNNNHLYEECEQDDYYDFSNGFY